MTPNDRNPTWIPVSMPDLGGNEERYVVDAIRSSWISSSGPYVGRFEREFAELCGTDAAVGVCNGTVALHLAMLCFDVGTSDEVLVPSLTYVATANAVRYVGGTPVFVDVDPQTWCIDPALLEGAITSRTKGIIAVHLYGHPADMDEINRIATKHGLWVIEDAAEAHMARYKGRRVGSLASLATFSFYGNKIFTSGEGGAITVNDRQLETRARLLKGQGVDPERRYFFPIVGYNFRITNIACALLCAQLERAREIQNKRLEVFSAYRDGLEGIRGIGFQPVAIWAEPAPWLFCVTVNEGQYGLSRDGLMATLGAAGIDSRPFFYPLHLLPPYVDGSGRRLELPVTEHLAATGLNLPTFPSLSHMDIARICDVIRRSRTGA